MLFQKTTNWSVKDHVSHCKKPSFESQYTAFRNGLGFIRFHAPSPSWTLLSEIRDKDGCPLLQQAEVTDFSIPSFDTSAFNEPFVERLWSVFAICNSLVTNYICRIKIGNYLFLERLWSVWPTFYRIISAFTRNALHFQPCSHLLQQAVCSSPVGIQYSLNVRIGNASILDSIFNDWYIPFIHTLWQ